MQLEMGIIKGPKKGVKKRTAVQLRYVKRGVCIEHPLEKAVHHHHIVPHVLGGTLTVPLCEACHSSATFGNHTKGFANHGKIIKIGMEMAKLRGVRIGRPPLADRIRAAIISEYAHIKSVRKVAAKLDLPKSTVGNVVKELRANK